MKVMGKAVRVQASADALTQLKERFATWRAVRKLGMRIPPELWSAAVEMVAVHGACRVAGELNLDYDMLKQRVALAGGKVTSTELAPRFVELFAAVDRSKVGSLSHDGNDIAILAGRHALYASAQASNPRRWSGKTRNWQPIGAITLNPERDAIIKMTSAAHDTERAAA